MLSKVLFSYELKVAIVDNSNCMECTRAVKAAEWYNISLYKEVALKPRVP